MFLQQLENRTLLSVSLVSGILQIKGGTGNDNILVFKSSTNIVVSGASASNFTVAASRVSGINANTDAGSDKLAVSSSLSLKTTLHGGSGNDALTGGGGPDQIFGDSGSDVINGGAGTDALFGDTNVGTASGGGNDTINPGTGSRDFALGGTGNDTITYAGRSDNLVLKLSTGLNDSGASGEGDKLFGENITGGNGSDQIFGDGAVNVLNGGNGNDVILGNGGNDKLNGDAGNDNLSGGNGNDILHGGSGADIVTGGAGADQLFGDADNDNMSAKDGVKDLVDGGTGTDTFTTDTIDTVLNKP